MRPLPFRLQTRSSSSQRVGRTSPSDATAAARQRRPSSRAAAEASVAVTAASAEEPSARQGPGEEWEEEQAAETHAVSFFIPHPLS